MITVDNSEVNLFSYLQGDVVACGSYEELQTSGIDFATLLKEYEEEVEAKESRSRASSVHSIPASLVSEIASLAEDIELQVLFCNPWLQPLKTPLKCRHENFQRFRGFPLFFRS